MWLVYTANEYIAYDLNDLGIYPRNFLGLIGIVTAPLLHGSLAHILSNTFPMLFLGITLTFFYESIAKPVFYRSWFLTGVLVWLFGKKTIHIGASGIIYALASFLFFYGLFTKNLKSLLISLAIAVAYGGLVYGILPMEGVSYESHLFGALIGAWNAYEFSRK